MTSSTTTAGQLQTLRTAASTITSQEQFQQPFLAAVATANLSLAPTSQTTSGESFVHLRRLSNNCFWLQGCSIWKGSTTSTEENKLHNNSCNSTNNNDNDDDEKNKLHDNNDENNKNLQVRLRNNNKKPTSYTTPMTASSTSRYGMSIHHRQRVRSKLMDSTSTGWARGTTNNFVEHIVRDKSKKGKSTKRQWWRWGGSTGQVHRRQTTIQVTIVLIHQLTSSHALWEQMGHHRSTSTTTSSSTRSLSHECSSSSSVDFYSKIWVWQPASEEDRNYYRENNRDEIHNYITTTCGAVVYNDYLHEVFWTGWVNININDGSD